MRRDDTLVPGRAAGCHLHATVISGYCTFTLVAGWAWRQSASLGLVIPFTSVCIMMVTVAWAH